MLVKHICISGNVEKQTPFSSVAEPEPPRAATFRVEPEPIFLLAGAAFFDLEPEPTQFGRSQSRLRDLGLPEPEPQKSGDS